MPETRKGERTEEVKARAVAALLEGKTLVDVAEAAGVNRTTLWRWIHEDDGFQRMREDARQQLVDGVVHEQVEALRGLTPDAIAALQAGLHANVHYELRKTTRTTEPEEGGKVIEEEWELVPVPDSSLSVRTADLVLKRIPEFASKLDVTVSGSLEARLAELDAADAGT